MGRPSCPRGRCNVDNVAVPPLSDQAASAWALVLAVGLLLNGLVFGATETVKNMLPPGWRWRRVVMPLIGLGFGCTFMVCLVVVMEASWSMRTVALVVLGAFVAFLGAAGMNAQAKESRRS